MDGSKKKIAGAVLVGFALLAVALFIRISQEPVKEGDGELVVAKTESTARGLIEVSDQDQDGIPDWQEALQTAEPLVIEEPGETYKPQTATEEFSIAFLQDMVLSRNYGELGNNPEELANRAAKELQGLAYDDLYKKSDIVISPDNSEAAVHTYANTIARIILENTRPANAPNELSILQEAYRQDDETILEELNSISSLYRDMIDRSLATPVPTTYSKEHLDLINVYHSVYNDIEAMKLAFSDPVKTVVRLKRYEEDATALYFALLNLQKQMFENGITFSKEEPAYQFIVDSNV